MKILMVCLGNICRSPLAQGVLEHLAKKHGLYWEIDSAGTGDYFIGHPPDHRSIAVAKQYGVDISGQCCRQFTVEDFDTFDRIYVMDESNLSDVLDMARSNTDRRKVKLFLGKHSVPDPYVDDTQFEPVYRMIEKRCKKIIEEELEKRKPDRI